MTAGTSWGSIHHLLEPVELRLLNRCVHLQLLCYLTQCQACNLMFLRLHLAPGFILDCLVLSDDPRCEEPRWWRAASGCRGGMEKMTRGGDDQERAGRSAFVRDWASLRFVSRSFALRAERRNGERDRAAEGRGGGSRGEECEIERVSGVKFAWTIPAFPTRLIKLWLC